MKKILFTLLIVSSIFLFTDNVYAATLPTPFSVDVKNGSGTVTDSVLTQNWGYSIWTSNNSYYSYAGSTDIIPGWIQYNWTNLNACSNSALVVEGSFVASSDVIFNLVRPIVNIATDSEYNECLISSTSGSELKFICYASKGTNGLGIRLTFQSYPINYWAQIAVIATSKYSCDIDESVIINNQNANAQNIINNQNNNASAIIGNAAANTTDIINNQNSNQQQTNEKLDNLNENLTDSNVESSVGSDFFSDFTTSDNGGISSIISAPLVAINAMLDNSCTPMSTTYKGKEISLSCGTEFWSQASTIQNYLNWFEGGILVYMIIRKLYKLIEQLKNPDEDRVEVMRL